MFLKINNNSVIAAGQHNSDQLIQRAQTAARSSELLQLTATITTTYDDNLVNYETTADNRLLRTDFHTRHESEHNDGQ